MTVYHFANESFGKYYTAVILKLKVKNPNLKFVLVISTITYSRNERIFKSKIEKKIRRSLGEGLNQIYDDIIYCKDVNRNSLKGLIKASDIGFISGFNQIFNLDVIKRFKFIINVHPSILPCYRGPVPSYWVLKNKELYSGFTIHLIDEKIDRGQIIAQGKIEITPLETVNSLDKKIALASKPYCLEVLNSLINDRSLLNVMIDPYLVYKNPVNYLSFPINSQE